MRFLKSKSKLTDKQFYKVKNEIFENYFPRVTPFEFYREIFPDGELQTRPSNFKEVGNKTPSGVFDDQKGKGNGIIYYDSVGDDGRWVVKRQLFYNSLDEVKRCKNNPNTYITPMSYFGARRRKENEHKIYALAIDYDGIPDGAKIKFLCDCFTKDLNGVPWWKFKLSIPPTFIVNSGHGVHLYWCFEESIYLTENVKKQLTELKIALMTRYWSSDFTTLEDAIQYQPIHQTFRAVGTPSKLGARYPVTAYRVSGRTTPQKLADSLPRDNLDGRLSKDWIFTTELKKTALEDAMKKYPNWEPNKECKNTYTLNRRVFDWWFQKVLAEGKCGGRYFALESLALYAVKCAIPQDEATRLLREAFEHLSKVQDDTHGALEERDWKDAIKKLKLTPSEVNINVDVLVHKTCIEVDKNRRNHRTQTAHLKRARKEKEMLIEEGDKKAVGGRPKGSANKEYQKLQVIIDYLKRNPQNTGTNVITRETGLSKHTVIKWKEKALEYIKLNGGTYQMTIEDFLNENE